MRLMMLTVLALATAVPLAAADLNTTVDTELTRLEATLNHLDPASFPKDMESLFKAARDGVTRVRNTRTPTLRFYRLRQPFVIVESLAFFSEHKRAMTDLASLGMLWSERKPVHDKRRSTPRGTFLERALQQAAVNRSQKLFRASLPYAKVDTTMSGLYYMSDAAASLKYADFVAGLAGESTEKAPDREALSGALAALERDAIALFEADPAARTAIQASATLKEARELFDQGLNEGASLVLLEGRLELSKRKQRAAKRDLAPKRDDSLLALWRGVEAEESAEVRELVHEDVLPLLASLQGGQP